MLETIDHGEGIRELRLSRPPVNALDGPLIAALRDAVVLAGSECRGVVLSGQAGVFSAGLDVPALLTLDAPAIETVWRDFVDLMYRLAASPVPVTAAITGHSPAGGAVLAVFCDYRIMARGDFTIGLNEVAVGLPVPPPVIDALARLVGAGRGERMLAQAAMLAPEAALQVGLVDELADKQAVLAGALAHARRLAALPAVAQRATRRYARHDLLARFEGTADALPARMASVWFSEETQTAMRALADQLGRRRRDDAAPPVQ